MLSIALVCVALGIAVTTEGLVQTHHRKLSQVSAPGAVFPYPDESSWGKNYAGWENCSGSRQSPINIDCGNCKKDAKDSTSLVYNYLTVKGLNIENNGHSVDVGADWGDITVDKNKYKAAGFHLHSPSEHTIKNKHYDMEMHIVHKATDASYKEQLAVVGILFEASAATEAKHDKCLKDIIENIPVAFKTSSVKKTSMNLDVCFRDILSGPFASYLGSLTTPPCTETVQWLEMLTPAKVSKELIKQFQKWYKGDNRPVKPLNNRSVQFNRVNSDSKAVCMSTCSSEKKGK